MAEQRLLRNYEVLDNVVDARKDPHGKIGDDEVNIRVPEESPVGPQHDLPRQFILLNAKFNWKFNAAFRFLCCVTIMIYLCKC